MPQVNSVSGQKISPVKKGARIGAVAGATLCAINAVAGKQIIQDVFQRQEVKSLSKTSKYACLATGIAIGAGIIIGLGSAIGAGIGKIVDTVKANKAQKAE